VGLVGGAVVVLLRGVFVSKELFARPTKESYLGLCSSAHGEGQRSVALFGKPKRLFDFVICIAGRSPFLEFSPKRILERRLSEQCSRSRIRIRMQLRKERTELQSTSFVCLRRLFRKATDVDVFGCRSLIPNKPMDLAVIKVYLRRSMPLDGALSRGQERT
jgi:hypothetical protein